MTADRKRSKGKGDAGQEHIRASGNEPGIDDRGTMQNAAPIDSLEAIADSMERRAQIRGMTPLTQSPLTQSKMHAVPPPAAPAEQPVLPRRSALVIEILAFVLIAFLVVS